MCLGGGGDGSNSSSTSQGQATANVEFNPVITIGGNSGEPVQDTGSTFAAKLLAAPPARIALPARVADEPETDNSTKMLAFLAVALVARKVLRG